MKISSRGRYALRVMVDLAENHNGNYIPLKDIIYRQGISQKYLESIMTALTKNNLLDSLHGKGGGYKLNREPGEYTVKEILLCTETTLEVVNCLEKDSCPIECECRTVKMWRDFSKMVNDFFENITLADLMQTDPIQNYVI